MNTNGAPHGNIGTGNQGMPFYRGAFQAQMAHEQDGDDSSFGGRRYVPPHMRGEELDIIRPESSMSNVSTNTFASQAPMGNYSYGPSQLTQNMSAYNPFSNSNNGPAPQRTPQLRQYMGPAHLRPGAPGVNRANGSTTTTPSGHMRSGYQGPGRVGNPSPAAPPSYNTTIAQPTPVRRDSGATTQSRAEYLANRIKQGHADDPFDPDYGNPGPSRRPLPLPKPITFPSHKSPSDNTLLPIVNGKKVAENNDGNVKAFLGVKKVELPAWLAAALEFDSPPTIERAFGSLPFIEGCRYAVPSTAGVVKVGGIPYATTRAEVNAFLGKNVKICYQPAGSGFQAVHIIMDRHSGKTMDAFVEVTTHSEAIWVVNQFQKRLVEKRPPKIGGRVVEVALSNQDELMHTIFPRAKQTTWENGVPHIDPSKEEYYQGVWSEGFKGFLQRDEIYHMYQHSEKPQRSPFVTRCMIRHYEYLISTLYKYPWFAIQHVYLDERDALFEATHASLRAMIDLLRRIHHDKPDASKPSVNTLVEYVTAVFVCPGFTDAQKNAVAKTLEQHGFGKIIDDRALNLRFGGVGHLAGHVPFKALIIQPGVDDKVVEYFAALFSDATTGLKPLSLADLHAMNASKDKHDIKKFGELKIKYDNCKSIADAGCVELRYLEEILARILPRRGTSMMGTASGSRVSSLQLPA